jgi:hypothetical protein
MRKGAWSGGHKKPKIHREELPRDYEGGAKYAEARHVEGRREVIEEEDLRTTLAPRLVASKPQSESTWEFGKQLHGHQE